MNITTRGLTRAAGLAAVIGLGVSLWRQQRSSSTAETTAAHATTVQAAPVR
jgi:hypothetical protein